MTWIQKLQAAGDRINDYAARYCGLSDDVTRIQLPMPEIIAVLEAALAKENCTVALVGAFVALHKRVEAIDGSPQD